jgi:RNA polymerase sigma-70 factor, ECF subfamily
MSRRGNFADCVVEHLPFLNRMVRALTRSDSLTEDIVQQTILKALVHADQFRLESTLKAWLASIAMNEVRQVYRCKWWTRAVPLTTQNLDGPSLPVQSPNAGYQAREREVLLRYAVSRLPEPYRCVVELCDLQCLPLKEAASRLRLTWSAIKTRQRRARMKLRTLVSTLKP